jgi:hypothetical protein
MDAHAIDRDVDLIETARGRIGNGYSKRTHRLYRLAVSTTPATRDGKRTGDRRGDSNQPTDFVQHAHRCSLVFSPWQTASSDADLIRWTELFVDYLSQIISAAGFLGYFAHKWTGRLWSG